MEQPRNFKTYVWEELIVLVTMTLGIFVWSLIDLLMSGGHWGLSFIFLSVTAFTLIAGFIDWRKKEALKLTRNL